MNMFGANTITNRCEDMVRLFQPVGEKLRDTTLYGMLSGMEEQAENPEYKKVFLYGLKVLIIVKEWYVVFYSD